MSGQLGPARSLEADPATRCCAHFKSYPLPPVSYYDYAYDEEWTYFNPACRRDELDAIVEKEPSRIFVTTQYVETTTDGWPCAADDHEARRAACLGTPLEDGAQCGCRERATVYPLGVEALQVRK